jgi:hypothetical protein
MTTKELIRHYAKKYKKISVSEPEHEETSLETELICKDDENELAFVVVDSE